MPNSRICTSNPEMNAKKRPVAGIVEAGLGSVGRIKILQLLARERGGLTRYAIGQRTNLKWDHIVDNLKVLVELGWVEEQKINPLKYKINLDNDIVMNLIEFFQEVGYL